MLNESMATAEATVYVTRVLPAPVKRVFEAWTDATRLKEWFGPAGYRAHVVKLDVRAGGEYEIVMLPPAASEPPGAVGPNSIVGRYREVSPSRRLVFTWSRVDPNGTPLDDGESLVTIDFRKVATGTEISITHEHLPTPESRDGHRAGWNGTLERFEGVVS